jgi:hypothetical protein
MEGELKEAGKQNNRERQERKRISGGAKVRGGERGKERVRGGIGGRVERGRKGRILGGARERKKKLSK